MPNYLISICVSNIFFHIWDHLYNWHRPLHPHPHTHILGLSYLLTFYQSCIIPFPICLNSNSLNPNPPHICIQPQKRWALKHFLQDTHIPPRSARPPAQSGGAGQSPFCPAFCLEALSLLLLLLPVHQSLPVPLPPLTRNRNPAPLHHHQPTHLHAHIL